MWRDKSAKNETGHDLLCHGECILSEKEIGGDVSRCLEPVFREGVSIPL